LLFNLFVEYSIAPADVKGRCASAAGTCLAARSVNQEIPMTPPLVKPVADPLDDIDRVAPVDSLMARQDRADLPGNRSDVPRNDAAPRDEADDALDETSADAGLAADPDDVALPVDDDNDVSLDDPDVAVALENAQFQRAGIGPDDDEPIEETERLGDDSHTV